MASRFTWSAAGGAMCAPPSDAGISRGAPRAPGFPATGRARPYISWWTCFARRTHVPGGTMMPFTVPPWSSKKSRPFTSSAG